MSKGKKKTAGGPKQVETLTHKEAKRKNIPTAELQSAAQRVEEIDPFEPVVYPRRHPLPKGETRPRDADLDPQIVWNGTRVRLTAEQIKEALRRRAISTYRMRSSSGAARISRTGPTSSSTRRRSTSRRRFTPRRSSTT